MKVHVSHILVTYQHEAEDLLKKLKSAADFSELARKYSQCGSASQGGDLGVVEVKRLDETFAEAAQNLKPGELSSIVRTRFGYHILKGM